MLNKIAQSNLGTDRIAARCHLANYFEYIDRWAYMGMFKLVSAKVSFPVGDPGPHLIHGSFSAPIPRHYGNSIG